MKLLWKLNCLLIILVIIISLVYTTKHKNTVKSLEKNRNYSKEKATSKLDFENFERAEVSKYDDIDNFLDNSNTKKLNDSLDDLNTYNSFVEKNSVEQKKPKEQENLAKKFYNKNKNLKISNGKNKNKVIKKIQTAKFNLEKNSHFPKTEAEIKENTKYSKCNLKSGFLYLVKNSDKLGKNPLFINAIPIYVEMNMNGISFQMGVMQKSSFNQVSLVNILKITQKFSNSFCFEIIENEVIQKSLAKIPVTLCAKDYQTMISWVSAIQQFKNCLNKFSDKYSNQENKTLIDFEKINKLLKDSHSKDGKVPKEIKKMYYQKSSPYIKSQARSETEQIISKQLKGIVNTLEEGSIMKNRMRRTMGSKLKKAENMAKDLRMKQVLINRILERRLNNEKEKEDEIKNKEHKQREVQLLRAVQQRIRQYKKQEMKQYNEIIDTRIKEIKNKANNDAKGIMRSILNQQKLSDYGDCYDDRLFGFKDKKYIKDTCFNLYGEHEGDKCEQKTDFCEMCCNFHVGIRYSNKLSDCKKKCGKVINGNKITDKEKNKSKIKAKVDNKKIKKDKKEAKNKKN